MAGAKCSVFPGFHGQHKAQQSIVTGLNQKLHLGEFLHTSITTGPEGRVYMHFLKWDEFLKQTHLALKACFLNNSLPILQ
jgi:hypothetical protein